MSSLRTLALTQPLPSSVARRLEPLLRIFSRQGAPRPMCDPFRPFTDTQTYVWFTDGSLRRYPARIRGKAARQFAKNQRHHATDTPSLPQLAPSLGAP